MTALKLINCLAFTLCFMYYLIVIVVFGGRVEKIGETMGRELEGDFCAIH